MNKIHSLFLFIIFFTVSGTLYGNDTEVRIHGIAKNFINEKIAYVIYGDRISYREQIISSSKVDVNGTFDLIFQVKCLTSGKLVAGFQSAELIVIPGGRYEIIINDSSINLLTKPSNPFINCKPLLLNVSESGQIPINRMVDSIQNIIDKTLLDTNKKITTSIIKERTLALKKQLEKTLKDSLNAYLQAFAVYSLASLDAMINRLDETRIIVKYFNEGTILYDHPVFMNFFNDFFDHYLSRRSRFVSFHDQDYCINTLASYTALADIMGKDSLLRNERLREYVMIKALAEYYYSPEYSTASIIKILTDLKSDSKFAEHRNTCENLLYNFKIMSRGEQIPAFKLRRQNGDTITQLQYSGIPVYYSFITTWCEDCISELMLIKKLHQKYTDKIKFVTIVCNGNESHLSGFLRQHQDWKWDFLILNKDIGMLMKYKVRSFPTFLFSGRAGDIVSYPANSPSGGIERFIDQFLFEKN